ncbi:DUF3427 domain-containing protein [Candidatus Methanarcanum hacksteinii]|uniref:DUF3427 domain-containing protein n=1 Tax=Candidatus Methanarcanum hacksteinii TaxID=2911857 RepID=UPI0037DC17B0
MYRFGDIFPISYDTLSLETDRIQYCSWTKFEVAEMIEDYFIKGLERGYIDESIIASEEYRPRLITNSAERKEKVITSIKQEMETCDEFMFSVAFMNSGGVNALAQEFRNMDRKGVKGKIIASQYQNFTEPNALRALLKNSNVDVRIITEDVSNMHSKCYIFRHGDVYDVIIGSSNLTNSALCENIEWNLKINSKESGEIIKDILAEFDHNFSLATIVDSKWIDEYSKIYDDQKLFRRQLNANKALSLGNSGRPQPNRMQKEALESIERIRSKGGDRALVISATGSGKTYLSAFDARKTKMKFLYIVHRLPILRKSMESFTKVMEGTETIEQYDPSVNNLGADCTFVTIQTLSKPNVLGRIAPDTFEYILIDEVHHAGAATYQAVINHFKPKFLLGMTATPDRTDDYDIYSLFDYNIAYDIRLKEAMEYKLICPFHYFGISDLSFDGESDEKYEHFLDAHVDQRIEHVISNAEYFGYCGNRVKGVVFCRGLEDAELYSSKFNAKGYRTVWVSGDMDKEYVETCIWRLEDDEGPYLLDYIFTADLFNEGVDIPSINQVIMLRPTKSPIVFIQQLGRGLRHHIDKEYVVVLDFIGNYERNYSIPMALSDDRSYNKSETRRVVSTGDSIIPGNSTISFDEISRKRIFESIDRSNFTETKIIKESYKNLRMKLGHIPRLTDFRKYGTYDVTNILDKYDSYHKFLQVMKELEYTTILDEESEAYLKQITRFTAKGMRQDEFVALRILLGGTEDLVKDLSENEIDVKHSNVLKVLNGGFYVNEIKLIEEVGGRYVISEAFGRMLNNPGFKDNIIQVIELSEDNWKNNYSDHYKKTDLTLNMRYTYEDVCRLLNWKKNVTAQNLGGYFFHEESNTFPVFINYVKGDDVVESQRYEDRFFNRGTLIAISKSRDSSNSKWMQIAKNESVNNVQIHLFIRKNKNDNGSKEFYYLGQMHFSRFLDDNKPVTIEYKLENEVRSDLYEYFMTQI